MPDNVYQFSDVPTNPASHAARLATIYPLAGKRAYSPDKEVMLRAGLAVLLDWRKRLVGLQGAGWGVLGSVVALQSFRNCPPSVYVTEDAGHPHPCHHAEICPWCYANGVRDVFKIIKAAGEIHKLVWTVGRKLVPFGPGIRQALKRGKKTILKLVQPNLQDCIGTYWSITAEPFVYREKKMMRISYRIIALVKPGERFEHIPDKWCGATITKPGARKLASVLSRALRYPEYLFRGDPEDVVAILDARRGLRLSESYGCFRATSPERETEGDAREEADNAPVVDGP